MGREQQITIAAAQAAHEVRRIITDIAGSGQVPAFNALDHDVRIRAIEHASHVLASTAEPSNMLDEIIWLTAEEIRLLDGEAPDPMRAPVDAQDVAEARAALAAEKEDSK